ncbi:MAG: homoserine kinase [Propionibacteriales bacterium]|nr:homoserine kinase [Propionibacteriales bacterium]
MSLVSGPVTVTVPATSANLGPGFDCLGLALDLHDTLTGEVADAGLVVEIVGEGADSLPRDETHLVVRAMSAAFAAAGVGPGGLRLRCDNVIPQARGLGSSSAAIVGGLALARALLDDGASLLPDSVLLALANQLEGHPDNVAPALFGGFVVCGQTDEDVWADQAPIAREISAVVFVPPTGVSTEAARGLLPAEIPHAAAAANTGRAALLVTALGHAPQRLLRATEDFLHQEYRASAMPESLALVHALRADGHAAVVSGAGPTVLVLTADGPGELLGRCPDGWSAYPLEVDHAGVRTVAS